MEGLHEAHQLRSRPVGWMTEEGDRNPVFKYGQTSAVWRNLLIKLNGLLSIFGDPMDQNDYKLLVTHSSGLSLAGYQTDAMAAISMMDFFPRTFSSCHLLVGSSLGN